MHVQLWCWKQEADAFCYGGKLRYPLFVAVAQWGKGVILQGQERSWGMSFRRVVCHII